MVRQAAPIHQRNVRAEMLLKNASFNAVHEDTADRNGTGTSCCSPSGEESRCCAA